MARRPQSRSSSVVDCRHRLFLRYQEEPAVRFTDKMVEEPSYDPICQEANVELQEPRSRYLALPPSAPRGTFDGQNKKPASSGSGSFLVEADRNKSVERGLPLCADLRFGPPTTQTMRADLNIMGYSKSLAVAGAMSLPMNIPKHFSGA